MKCASGKETFSTTTGKEEATQSPGKMSEREAKRRIELKRQFIFLAMKDIEAAVNDIIELEKISAA
jgi:hypothetical protein